MLGVQLSFNGDKLVVCNNVVVGVLVDDSTEDCLGVLRILGNEYAEQVRLIQIGLRDNAKTYQWYMFSRVLQGELIVNVEREVVGFREAICIACYPMKIDNLVVTYVKCKKAYTIKQSAIYVKNELKRIQVIK